MKALGKAQLVDVAHESGVPSKGWDLGSFGGPIVFMGAKTQPLPPAGTTVDRGNLRLDAGTGDVWQLEGGEGPPSIGRKGTSFSMKTALIIGIAVYLVAGGGALKSLLGRRRR